MRVTASHIAEWTNTRAKEAQATLPRLVRQLCFQTGTTRHIAFPAGDSTYRPGWDGTLESKKGDAWVPAGSSCWEIGCDKDVGSKASGDYQKRTLQTDAIQRAASTFIFVTPRRWHGKTQWLDTQRGKVEWSNVLAYDADDLEQWLEQSPTVALKFAEELGLIGPGVESLERYWLAWSQQSNPPITTEALFTDRTGLLERLLDWARQQGDMKPLALRADSQEEAAAFAAAAFLHSVDMGSQALMVTEPDGWRFVAANPQLRFAIAARAECAMQPVFRPDLRVIIPLVVGDISSKTHDEELLLDRPNIYDFEKALVVMGVEESDAKRLALSTGRSWSVFRRHRAINPAIRHPEWLDAPEAKCLTCVCLLGAWKGDNPADRSLVERIAGKPYEDIEADLRFLARQNDAPILLIGDVWKAKSPLELLDLFGGGITRDQWDRFFQVALDVLSLTDPQLELPEEERYAAQVYGKVRPQSGLLFESLCDTLIKLAVRGPENPALLALGVEHRVARLVHDLLDDASESRWLSLASYLPALAEAAPEAFLRAIEKSLSLPNQPVTRLITETTSAGIGGGCWHAGLLWALETLAWAPKRLARVVFILARLTHVPYTSNWSNTPGRSLQYLFLSWLPQTAASLEQHIQVLDQLVERDPDAAFDLLDALTERVSQHASYTARPKWRDDDAGAGHGASDPEIYGMLLAAREHMFRLSENYAPRLVRLFENMDLVDIDGMTRALALIKPFTRPNSSDHDREILRTALRTKLHWHRNYDDNQGPDLENRLAPVEAVYKALAPENRVIRHRWLFADHWLQLPAKERDDHRDTGEMANNARLAALDEIAGTLGLDGIRQLALESGQPGVVGMTLATLGFRRDDWSNWLLAHGGDFSPNTAMSQCVAGLLRTLPEPESADLLRQVLALGNREGWPSETHSRLLVLARCDKDVWEMAAACGMETEDAYWNLVQPVLWMRDMGEEADFVLRRLLEAKRPKSALQCCLFELEKTDARLLFDMLGGFLRGEEPDGPRLESWHFGQIVERLEQSGEIERIALIQLEFSLFPALGYGNEARAKVLYEAVMSDPATFAELITILYKPKHGDKEGPISEAMQTMATHAWNILHHCTRQPGTNSAGEIDGEAFLHFIEEARDLCGKADRLAACDETLGEILAHAPADADGTWPFKPARQVLDRPELEDMRRGFVIGTRNKRGMTSRSPWDGGDQERDLAAYYRKQAAIVQSIQPHVASMLEEIADSYEHEGHREDISANLRKEGY
jgi:hypothetical protein